MLFFWMYSATVTATVHHLIKSSSPFNSPVIIRLHNSVADGTLTHSPVMLTWRCGKTSLFHPEVWLEWRRTCVHHGKRVAVHSVERDEDNKNTTLSWVFLLHPFHISRPAVFRLHMKLQGGSVLTTHLSVQPAVALIFKFLQQIWELVLKPGHTES